MKPICLDLSHCNGLGDVLASTPIIRKLKNSYSQKITLITKYPELFTNNQYVEKTYKPNSVNIDFFKQNYIYHNSFHNIGQKNEFGVEIKSNAIDIRQHHAIQLGFTLYKDEMEMDYLPNKFEPINDLPNKFVLIHPVQTWPSRTWSAENWMILTKMLNESGVSVVSTGKDSSEVGFFNIDKPVFNFEIKNGLNLMNKTDISQAWHLIDKSLCFVTMDSGLLHLAGTTDSEILMLGSSIRPELRAPYRNGSQEYKFNYIMGSCGIFCASDMKYGVKEWGTIQGVPPLPYCLENKPTYECHPSVMNVYNKIMEIIEKQ